MLVTTILLFPIMGRKISYKFVLISLTISSKEVKIFEFIFNLQINPIQTLKQKGLRRRLSNVFNHMQDEMGQAKGREG